MQRVLTSQLKEFSDKKVIMQGWVHRIRKLGQVTFIVLRDRSGTGQIVIQGNNIDSALVNESVIGAERLTMKLLDLKNIREACLFPRDRTRLTP